MPLDLFQDLTIFERGWLSSNNILLHGGEGEDATLIDSGYVSHADQTLALLRHALRPGRTLSRIVNTHLHSDHCGGNAALLRAFGARIVIPPGDADAVAQWDEGRLTYQLTSQRFAIAWPLLSRDRRDPISQFVLRHHAGRRQSLSELLDGQRHEGLPNRVTGES